MMQFFRSLLLLGAILLMFSQGFAAVDPVQEITTLNAEPSYEKRHHSLHGLSATLLASNSSSLIDFMCAEQVPEGMREVDYMSLVNDIYNLLLTNDTEVQQLFDISLKVIPDKSAGQIWRDYCMQKLNYTLGREDVAPESIQQALALLDTATQGAYPRMQGTAFIAAYKFKDHPFDPKPNFLNTQTLGERALTAAKDVSKPLIDRITSLQTAAKCDVAGTLAYATTLISESETSEPMLKVVALATIGQIGSEAQIPLLSEYRLSPDIRLRKAARVAINRIQDPS